MRRARDAGRNGERLRHIALPLVGMQFGLRRRGARTQQQIRPQRQGQGIGQRAGEFQCLVVTALAQASHVQGDRDDHIGARGRRKCARHQFRHQTPGRQVAVELEARYQPVQRKPVDEDSPRMREHWRMLQTVAALAGRRHRQTTPGAGDGIPGQRFDALGA